MSRATLFFLTDSATRCSVITNDTPITTIIMPKMSALMINCLLIVMVFASLYPSPGFGAPFQYLVSANDTHPFGLHRPESLGVDVIQEIRRRLFPGKVVPYHPARLII